MSCFKVKWYTLLCREGGLGVSLFRLLSERHPNSMVTLDHQYRMNRLTCSAPIFRSSILLRFCSEIMLLSNSLFYDHQLKCGSVGVASGRLLLPLPDRLSSDLPDWFRRAVSPDHPVVFLNTDKVWPFVEDGLS